MKDDIQKAVFRKIRELGGEYVFSKRVNELTYEDMELITFARDRVWYELFEKEQTWRGAHTKIDSPFDLTN